MTVLLANNVSSALAAPITASATSMTVTNGSRFPVLTPGQYFYATIIATNGIVEIVKVNTRNGNAMSITRAQDGTNAQAFASGARVEMRINAASVKDVATDTVAPIDARLTTAEGDITALEGRMTTAEGDITTIEGDIVALEAFDTALATSTGSTSVGFLQAGSGASLRTVQSKLRDTVSVKDFGAVGDGIANDTAAIQAALLAVDKGNLYFPSGTYKCNIVVGNNTRIVGAGREKTIFVANNTALPIIHLNSDNSTQYRFIGGQDFSVQGNSTAQIGIKIGVSASPLPGNGSVVYGSLDRVYVFACVTNIYAKDTVGFHFTDVFSYYGVDNGLLVDSNDIVTIAKFTRCNFSQNKTGLNLTGGAVLSFDTCGVESNLDVGALVGRSTLSGARQIMFDSCWFEGNSYAPTTGAASTIFIDFASAQDYPNYLKFTNCVISSPATVKDVYLFRGNVVEFDTCTFTEFNSTRLDFSVANQKAYALLRNCGTIADKPSPTLYTSFPALDESVAGRILGFAYEYWYNGLRYTNHFPQSFYMRIIVSATPIGNVTGNGAVYTSANLAGASSTFELYDYGANFSTGAFTAPETGIYSFAASWPITDFSTAMTTAEVHFIVNPSGTSTTYVASKVKLSSYGATDIITFNGSTQIKLTKGDVVVTAIRIAGGAGDTADVYRDGTDPGLFYFTGAKLQ